MNSRVRVLVVEDDDDMRESCRQALESAGYGTLAAAGPKEAEPILLREPLDLVVTDLRMSDGGGQEVVRTAKKVDGDLPVILITAYPTVQSAVEGFKSGVVDYLLKPFTDDQLLEAVEAALASNRARTHAALLRQMSMLDPGLPEWVGSSPALNELLANIRRVAALEGHVLICGETGSGKELAARAIHRFSRCAGGPFVVVNCAAIPGTLIEAEIFGFEKGAFTGATSAKPGLIEAASGGSLFLDEVGDLAPSAQAKMLRCLEDGSSRRIGGVESRNVSVRILAATNKNLNEEIDAGHFRKDFFYRISALEVTVPPLREHPEDIPQLAVNFLDTLLEEGGNSRVSGISEEAMDILVEYSWPGNVRELQNIVQKAYARSGGPLIGPEDLPECRQAISGSNSGLPVSTQRSRAVAGFERDFLVDALRRHDGNVTRTAEDLGVHRTTLHRLMKKHGISSS